MFTSIKLSQQPADKDRAELAAGVLPGFTRGCCLRRLSAGAQDVPAADTRLQEEHGQDFSQEPRCRLPERGTAPAEAARQAGRQHARGTVQADTSVLSAGNSAVPSPLKI